MALTDIDGQRLGDSVSDKLGDRNLIINGAQTIAQRGTSDTSASGQERFVTDRFLTGIVGTNSSVFAITQSTDAPTGFTHSLKWDCTTADSSLAVDHQSKIEHRIEGLNVAHLGWGTSNAQTVTLSFYVKSNLTGNTQVAFNNSDNNRSYVSTFTIDAANTWERKTLTVPGDTTGTWVTNNDIGLRLRWGTFGSDYQTSSVDQWNAGEFMSRDDSPINFSSSTSDELYLTGVQLEVGNTATPFQHEPYAKTLLKCMRYFQIIDGTVAGGALVIGHGATRSSDNTHIQIPLGIALRDKPAASVTNTIRIIQGGNSETGSSNSTTVGGVTPSVLTDNTNFNVTLNYNGNIGYSIPVNTGGISMQLNTPGTFRLDSEL